MKGPALQKIVLDTWLAATGAGVTSTETTIGGRKVLKVDYGDKGSMSYVVTDGDIVLVVETANAKLAADSDRRSSLTHSVGGRRCASRG